MMNQVRPGPFDEEFYTKLKMYYSNGNALRRTGRTHETARVLLEVALESMTTVKIQDHYVTDGGGYYRSSAIKNLGKELQRICYVWKELYGINIHLSQDGVEHFQAQFVIENLL